MNGITVQQSKGACRIVDSRVSPPVTVVFGSSVAAAISEALERVAATSDTVTIDIDAGGRQTTRGITEAE